MERDPKIIADCLMAVAGLVGSTCLIPQIKQIFRKKAADQFSWTFLIMTNMAIIMYIIAKCFLRCWAACVVDVITLTGYITLVVQKLYYAGRDSHAHNEKRDR